MQINRIQNNTPQFQGIIQIQNFRKGGKIMEMKTSFELDRGLAQSALKNVFGGSWANVGDKSIPNKEMAPYFEALKQTLGINLPKSYRGSTHIERKLIDSGYTIKADKEYKITHIREDINIWD